MLVKAQDIRLILVDTTRWLPAYVAISKLPPILLHDAIVDTILHEPIRTRARRWKSSIGHAPRAATYRGSVQQSENLEPIEIQNAKRHCTMWQNIGIIV
jgi:hypothetical protein